MSHPERKRCFECGASFPPDAHTCDEDHIPLWPDTINGVWKIEGVLAPRLGGATCAAYHLHTGARVAIDLVRGGPTPDPAVLKALTQEVQALRLLEHSSLLRLVEEGSDRAGIHYLVTDLGPARPLPDMLEDWQRSSTLPGGPLPASTVSQVGRQILSLLSSAHRLGLAHGALTAAHIYVISDEDSLTSISRTGAVRLHGLRAIGTGPLLHSAISADLAGVADVLYELATGKSPPGAKGGRPPSIPSLDPKVAQVILRGLGADPNIHYGSADEMLRALVVAAPPQASEVSATALAALTRTDPQMRHVPPSEISMPRFGSEPSIGGLPPVGQMSGANAALPAPPLPLGPSTSGEMPVRSRLSGELRQVSFKDLITQDDGPRKEETLARSRRRVSASSLKVPALPPPAPEFADSYRPEFPPGALSSGDNAPLEPTADLSALPVDFASGVSGRVLVGSSHSELKSEISLPPHPAPESLLSAIRANEAKAAEAAKIADSARSGEKNRPIDPPKLARSGEKNRPIDPPKLARSGEKNKPIEPPKPAPSRRSMEDIDPLASTGQAPIPPSILAAAQQLQAKLAAAASASSKPDPIAASAFSSRSPEPDRSALARQAARPIWHWLVLAGLVLGCLILLLLAR